MGKKLCKAKNKSGLPCKYQAVFGNYCIRHYEMLRRNLKSKSLGKNGNR